MSPTVNGILLGLQCFPRVSGDEPGTPDVPKYAPWFSPRERG